MYYGVQYYPEHWPEERWAVDFDMMRRAKVNTLRMGEFAWSAYEPEEGTLDFSWMERALDGALAHGIRTIMCTCSRTPPPWAFLRHPGIRSQHQDGTMGPIDSRYQVGLAHPEFTEVAQRIDQAVVDHFAGHPAITAWQIDNEVGGSNDCYCERCLLSFQAWLEQRFGSVRALHEAIGEHFWSFHVNRFTDVPAPFSNPQLRQAYRHFLSDLNVQFTRQRAEMIRGAAPGVPVTTNFQSSGAIHTDYACASPLLDVPGMNHYPARSPQLALDLHRGQRGALLILEQFTRLGVEDAGPGRMRLWAYLAIAHGAKGISFFRWRPARWGREQFGDGLLPHSGEENDRYRQLSRMGEELDRLDGLLDSVTPVTRVAVLHSYPCRWALHSHTYGIPKAVNHFRAGVAYHNALLRRNIMSDVVTPTADLSRYDLVIAPALFLVDDDGAQNLQQYVADGGHLCLTAASGVVDAFGKSFDTPRPGPLADVAGVTVDELLPLDEPVELRFAGAGDKDVAHACGAADSVSTTTAEPLAAFAAGWREGNPAITRNHYGKGSCTYVAAFLDDAGTDAVVADLCALSQIAPGIDTPEGIAAYRLADEGHAVLMLLNNTEQPQSVELGETWTDALNGGEMQRVTVPAVDLCILKQPA